MIWAKTHIHNNKRRCKIPNWAGWWSKLVKRRCHMWTFWSFCEVITSDQSNVKSWCKFEREKKKKSILGKGFVLIHFCRRTARCEEIKKPHGFLKGSSVQPGRSLKDTNTQRPWERKKKKQFHDGAAYTRHNADFLKTPKPTSTTNERSLRSRIDAELLRFLDLNFFGSAGKTSHFRGCHQVATCDKRVPTRTNGDGKPSPSSPASRLQHEHLTFQPSPSSGNTRQLQNEPLVDAVECDAGVMTQWNETNVDTI